MSEHTDHIGQAARVRAVVRQLPDPFTVDDLDRAGLTMQDVVDAYATEWAAAIAADGPGLDLAEQSAAPDVGRPHTAQGRTEDSGHTASSSATDAEAPYVGSSRGRRDATEVGSVLDQLTGDVITGEDLAGLGVTAEEFETWVDAEAEPDVETAARRCDRALHEADAAIRHIDQAAAENQRAVEQDRRVSRWAAEDRTADAINAGQDAGLNVEQDWS